MRKRPEPRYIWMQVSNDKYEFPLALADTAKDLARLIGSTESAVRSGECHWRKEGVGSSFRKVEI